MRDLIKNKSGASMMFVLAVMFFLLTIGASALTAAASNAGAGFDKRSRNQLMLYADSLERSIKASLQSGETGKLSDTDTLGGQLLRLAYKQLLSEGTIPSGTYTKVIQIELTPYMTEYDLDDISITLEGVFSIDFTTYVQYEPEITEQKADEGGNPMWYDDDEENPVMITIKEEVKRVSQTANITSGTVDVFIKVTHESKQMISVAHYTVTGAKLIDDGYNGNAPMPDEHMLLNAGEWELISHEKADW